MPDSLPPINPGIRRLVAALNAGGWETCDSGDGQTHDYSCDRPYPYVVVKFPHHRAWSETNHLAACLAGLIRPGVLREVAIGPDDAPEPGAYTMELTWQPLHDHAFLVIAGVADEHLFPPIAPCATK